MDRNMVLRNLLFVLACVVFCWPFMGTVLQGDFYSLFTYLFAVWGATIFLMYLLSRRSEEESEKEKKTDGS